jgi:hypothetical protein
VTFGARAGRHHHVRAGSSTSPSGASLALKIIAHVAELVGHGLDRLEVLGERDAFLERLDDSPRGSGGRPARPAALAVGERDAAPRADERHEVGSSPAAAARARSARTARPCARNSSRMPRSSSSKSRAHSSSPSVAASAS